MKRLRQAAGKRRRSDDAAGCAVAVTGGQPNGAGTFNFTARATDVAGNTQTVTGSVYRWDATAMQCIYNYGTPRSGAGFYWRLFAQLDDGETYFVDIALR